MKSILFFICSFVFTFTLIASDDISQWRGPDRNGNYKEDNLFASWPETGPEMLWNVEGIGNGYSSVSVSDEIVYVTGKKDTIEYLTALNKEGEQLWQIPYGLACKQSYSETRCTPTIQGNYIYLISGRGEVVCVNTTKQEIQWKIEAYDAFNGAYALWEIAESPLIVDDKIIYTPGGDKTTMVALDKSTGETIWQTESLYDSTAYVSPILVERGGNKIIVNITRNYLLGVNAENGKILWKSAYSEIDKPTQHPEAPFINCVTPIYSEGKLFITSGYDHTSVMFDISPNGEEISIAWKQKALDTHHGGVVLVDGYIYGSNWINNSKGNWVCINWSTGELVYEEEWETKGSIISADGKLFLYEERRGNVAMVEADPTEFKLISEFRHEKGSGPNWAHPVIHNGILYIRHGKELAAYKIGE